MYHGAEVAMRKWKGNLIPRTNEIRANTTEIANEENFWNGFSGEDKIFVGNPFRFNLFQFFKKF